MKILDIKKGEFFPVFLFSALFALIEGSSAVALSTAEAMFLAGIGVEGLPLIYLLLFVLMSGAMLILAYLQSKISVGKLLRETLIFVAFSIAAISLTFTLSPSGFLLSAILYALKLGANIWIFASFTLFWNFADEYFSIRDGKRLYSIFAAFGCIGGVLGAGVVFVFSEYLAIDASILLWIWLLCVCIAYPFCSIISSKCRRLDSGVNFESAAEGVVKIVFQSAGEMFRSKYVRAMMAMYIAVVCAAAINEYAAMFAFSEDARETAIQSGLTNADEIQKASQLSLASLFGALGAAVNVFNFAVNLFVFNRLVAKFGVKNIALLQSILFMVAFVWLIDAFGVGAAIFSFFMYRGILESVDADNENLMISILPGNLRQQVRLAIEAFVVPFATALAGLFLMFYAKGADTVKIDAPWFASLSEWLNFDSLGITEISVAGFLVSLVGLFFAFGTRSEYSKVLEENLRSGYLDFSKTLAEISQEDASVPDFSDPDKILAAASVNSAKNPPKAVRAILDNANLFVGEREKKAAALLTEALSKNDFSAISTASKMLADPNASYPDFIVFAIARTSMVPIASFVPDMRQGARIRKILKIGEPTYSSEYSREKIDDVDAAEKVKILNDIKNSSGSDGIETAEAEIDNENREVRKAALSALAVCARAGSGRLAKKISARFKNADSTDREVILRILHKCGMLDCLEIIFRGVSSLPATSVKPLVAAISDEGAPIVPELVKIIGSENFDASVKSVCSAALNKIFPQQIKLLARDTSRKSVIAAYECACVENELARDGDCTALEKIYKWKRRGEISFAVDILSTAGQLPSSDPILSAIFAHGGKEAANALEILEQGMNGSDFSLMLPLIDGRNTPEIAEYGRRTLSLKTPSKNEILETASKSDFDEEFLAAATVFSAHNSDLFARRLCEKIGKMVCGSLRNDLHETLDYFVFGKRLGDAGDYKTGQSATAEIERGNPASYTFLNKYSAIGNCGFFDEFEPSALTAISQRAEPVAGASINEDSILIISDEGNLKNVRWIAAEKNSPAPISDFPVLGIPVSDMLQIATQYPDAALSLYFGKERLP